MQEEIWKAVKGFEGYYEISSLGRVRSVERYVRQAGHLRYVPQRIKKQVPNRYGYPSVTLCRNRKSRQYHVHRLIAEAFIPNPENKPFVDHINTDITDYRIENLRWVTAKENANNSLTILHSRERVYTKERSKKILATKIAKGINSCWIPIKVYQYSKKGEFIAEYDSISQAKAAFGHNIGIGRALNDKTQSAGGYMWFTEKQESVIYQRRRNKRQREVLYCDKNGGIIAEYRSISEASEKTGIPRGNIRRSIDSDGTPRKYKFMLKE